MTATLIPHTIGAAKFIEHHIGRGNLAPAARTMDPVATARQFNEANALEPGDTDYMRLPSLAWSRRMIAAGRAAYMNAEPCAPMRSRYFADFLENTGAKPDGPSADQAIADYVQGYRDQMDKVTARLVADLEPLN